MAKLIVKRKEVALTDEYPYVILLLRLTLGFKKKSALLSSG